ncbi:MAG: FtsX-like permease family protein, partial [Promethearchaeota archaeon]
LGLNLILRVDTSQNGNINQQTYLSGAVNEVYSQFNTLIVSLVIILAFMIVVAITTTIIIFKKRDIAIMKALGTLPGRLYGFYLLEVYIIFLIGFVIGIIFGLIAFGIFSLIMFLLGNPIIFHIDLYYTTALFVSCIIGIFVFSGYTLRQIGNQKIIQTFSKDIPYNYDASKGLTKIPRWISSHGFNLKIAVVNTVRRKGEFVRYFFIFSMIFLCMRCILIHRFL